GHHVVTLDVTIRDDAKRKEKKNCPKHSDSCLEFYCRDCKQAICVKCLMTSHKNHTTSDMVDVWSETVKELKEIGAVFGDMIVQLKEDSGVISDNIIKIQSYVVKSCERVDQQVQKVCTAAQKAGDDLKTRLHIAFNDEEEKMKKLLKDTEDVTKELRINAQCAAEMIQNEQMMDAVESLPSFRSKVDKINSVELDVPDLSFISFKEKKINMPQLGTIIVNPAVTFHHNFFLNQFKKKGRGDEIESRDIKKDGLVWYLTVEKELTGMSFGIGLANEDIRSLSCKYTLTLTNKRYTKSVKMGGNVNFKKENPKIYVSNTAVTWAQLCDPKQGFVDSRKRFTVKASVSVRNVQK
ncbi:E3 ubiquitin-protein ligase TRIM36, partial [Patella vulgata]|uniref:E3 ubiquitin-protein ligase TRIM36 n=1 Tax=Patella vulgata TaxID=6465 RepID=UPI0024A7C7DD